MGSKQIEASEMLEIEVFCRSEGGTTGRGPLSPKTVVQVDGNTIVTSCERPLSSKPHDRSFRYTFVDGVWRESFYGGEIHMGARRTIKEYGTGREVVPPKEAHDA